MKPHYQLFIAVAFLAIVNPVRSADSFAGSYHVVRRFNIPGDGGWDYISIDSRARRLYVSHETQLEVLDADSGKVLGQIGNTPGVHGAAIAVEFHRGFTSNGGDSSVTIFDTRTLTMIKKIHLQSRPDAIVYDTFSKRVFPLSERTTVVDAHTGEVAGIFDLGGDPEAGVSDGKGTIYVNLADKGAIAVVDTKTLSVRRTYPIDHCTSAHSLSYDLVNQRLFVGCRDGLVVLDAANGKMVQKSIICSDVDGSAFDPDKKLLFESCGEGVISVIRQVTPDYYILIETMPTALYAKTMAFDPVTKAMYLPTAEFESVPNADPKAPFAFERRIKPGSFTVLVVGTE